MKTGEYDGCPMSSKTVCDECGRKIKESVKFWTVYNFPLNHLEFCYACFNRHWKPGSRHFSLKQFMSKHVTVDKAKRKGLL